jgi:hypothetical protein
LLALKSRKPSFLKEMPMAKEDLVLREGSRHSCPHCGKAMEIHEGTLKPIHNREAFDRATQGKRDEVDRKGYP